MIAHNDILKANERACRAVETAQDLLAELKLPEDKQAILVDALIHANVMRIALNRIANGSPLPKTMAYDALAYTKPETAPNKPEKSNGR